MENQFNQTNTMKTELKQILDKNNYGYTEIDGKINVTHKGYVDLRSLTTLPEGTSFNNKGYVSLRSLTTLPAETSFNNKGYVDLHLLTTLTEGTSFNNQGGVFLRSLTTLPEGTSFNNKGYVDLSLLTTLTEGTSFNNQGYVGLYSLTTLPEKTSFNNKGNVSLRSLTTLPAETSFNNQGNVDLSLLTTLPEGTSFNNQGGVDLHLLTTLPAETSFNNKGGVFLNSLTNEAQIYRGKQITLRYIDGYTMLIESEKITKGITVCKARYFGGGEIKDLEQCYVAKVGNHWAHGKTVKEAIQDATDKAKLDADVADIVAEIKLTDKVTIAQYRAITGACREGCRQFLHSIGKPDATDLPLVEVIRQVKGHYGFDRFIEATTTKP